MGVMSYESPSRRQQIKRDGGKGMRGMFNTIQFKTIQSATKISVTGGRSFCVAVAFVVAGVIAAPVSVYAQAQEPTARAGCVVGDPDDYVALKSFSPELNEFGYPAYYIDQNNLGLDLCDETTDIDPLCGNPPFGDPLGEGLPLDLAPAIDNGNFWHETFYSLANTNMTWGTGADSGNALLVLAVEGVWDNAAEAILDGDQLVFSRIRARVSLPNDAACAGTYTITHPYGTDTLEVTAADIAITAGTRAINMTDDCLHGVIDGVITPNCGVLPGPGIVGGDQFSNIIDPTRSRISHYLQWDVDAPPGYIGDPLVPHAVTGSPCNTNFYRIEGPCAGDIDPSTGLHSGTVETSLFSVQGRSAQLCGDGILDESVGEECDDGNTVDGDCCSSTCQNSGPAAIGPAACAEGGAQDDANVCTTNSCTDVDGCVFTDISATCDDLNGCTNDSCDVTLGCLNDANTDPCDDGNACTQTDTCANSECVGANPVICTAFNDCHEVGTCDTASGICSDPFSIVDKACGNGGDTECTNPDTCDGAGSCLANDAAGGTSCGDAGSECVVQDTCDGGGSCSDNGFVAADSACGNSSDSECTNPDTCNGAGSCLDNHEAAIVTCGDTGTECTNQDFCDGGGSCTDNGFVAVDTSCGAASDTECTNPDTCNGAGSCLDNHEAVNTTCGDAGTECTNQDRCDGGGSCTDNGFVAADIACGHVSDTECTDPDTCNGAGSCVDNHEDSGIHCGDAGTECTNQDMCDGIGACTDNGFVAADTACGDGSDTECTNADTCDGSGACQDNHETAGTVSATQCDDVNDCTDNECNGSGGCQNPNLAVGATCGDPADTECTNADTCDGSGACQDNHETAGTVSATQCDDVNDCTDNECNGSGGCQNPNLAVGATCGDPADTECTNADTCDGSGACQDNHEDSAFLCGDDGTECIVQDACDGGGSCTDNGFVAADSACGDGSDTECTNADTCDGSGACQPNDASDGIACGDNGTECINQDTCGAGSCTDNGFLASGSSCSSDGNECTDDECDGGGTCSHPNNANSCEDGDPATWADQCSAGSCESGFFACPMFPLDGCRAPAFPGKSSIYLRTTSGGAKDMLKWKWKAGAATSLADYGDPVNSDEISLCLYDEDNDVPTLVVEQVIEPGGTCGGKACWKGSARMYKYNSKGVATSHGVGNLKLKTGGDGKASIAAKGKGVGIALPAAALQADSHITMQLVSEPGGCWETVFDASSVTIKNGKLKAK